MNNKQLTISGTQVRELWPDKHLALQ